MSDRMTPIPFSELMEWTLLEYAGSKSIFGVRLPYRHQCGELDFLGEKIETPFGPAAGPHTQLAQNIIAAYAGGARFFELKTVQTLDGEDLPVSKPCIDARDEAYNVEWSTELRVPEALAEYVKAWFALKLISKEFGLGAPDGFMFNMSVGYDLEGIKSEKIDSFIEGLKDASKTEAWRECADWARDNLRRFAHVSEEYLNGISPKVCGSITLSTLHGCPPQEIERIASYLIEEKKIHTFIKCNPTLLGYEFARETLDKLGFDYIDFDDRHFKGDLQYADAVPMITRLAALAESNGLEFGVKLTNTFPVNNPKDVMPGSDEMYMSGRPLFPLTVEVARRLSRDFGGKLRVSWSGGADFHNISELFRAGIWPVTVATTLLKPGGYLREKQLAQQLCEAGYKPFAGIDLTALENIAASSLEDEYYKKPAKAIPPGKNGKPVPLLDCFAAPCTEGCPINQDVPEYIALVGEGRYADALSVILDKNPLPFVTGTICGHRCATKCTRGFYEEPVLIRSVKLVAAEKGISEIMSALKPGALRTDAKVAIIGGGPAGMAAAYFLARNGIKAVVFEKGEQLGGVVRKIIPDFRIAGDAIDRDAEIIRAAGAEFVMNSEKTSVDELRSEGYKYVVFAGGAWKPGELRLEKGECLNVFDFLSDYKKTGGEMSIGRSVAVIGGGNTAMDAARAALRVKGVENVSVVYRRTKQYMPADLEELEQALGEGVIFRELLAPVALENGKLICEKMKLGERDASGRRSPVPAGERAEIMAETVIAAVGESVDTEIYTANGIKLNDMKRAETKAETLETSVPGVYVAGDARRGPATVVEAIADAAAIARAIAQAEGLGEACGASERAGRAAAKSVKGVLCLPGEPENENTRCLDCGNICENCADVCPNRANISVTPAGGRPQIVHVDIMCNECGNCATFCPWESAPYKDKFTMFSDEAGLADSDNAGFLPLGDGKYKIRLDGEEFITSLEDGEQKLPKEITELIKAFIAQIPVGGRAN